MLKISIMELLGKLPTLRLEGQISGPWVEALRKVCDGELTTHEGLILDLTDVSFVDRDGIMFLTTLPSRQVVLVNYQPFVAELLKSAGFNPKAKPKEA